MFVHDIATTNKIKALRLCWMNGMKRQNSETMTFTRILNVACRHVVIGSLLYRFIM